MTATQYIQSALFLMLGIAAVKAWVDRRERREAHLAWATALFGVSQLVSAISTTLYTSKGNLPPRGVSITSGVLTFLAVYAFLLFLSDFINYPWWAHGLSALATIVNLVLVAIERPEFAIVSNRLVRFEVDNPISYTAYLEYIIVYLAVAFGLLWVTFAMYGVRVQGLARFRMLTIAAGFFVLFVAIGLIPRVVFGRPSSGTVRNVLLAVRVLALASAPCLFVGFTPPRWLTRRFAGRPVGAQPGGIAPADPPL